MGVVAPASDAFHSPVFGSNQPGSLLKRVGDIATFTTLEPHRLLPGSAVRIRDAAVNGVLGNNFNGDYEVLDVPSSPHIGGQPTSFTYRIKGTVPAANAAGAPTWREYWRTRHIAIERNVVEITKGIGRSYIAGLNVNLGSPNPAVAPRVYRRYAAKENLIRQISGAQDTTQLSAIATTNCEKAVLQNNIIDVASVEREVVAFNTSDKISFFNNQRVSGAPLTAYDNVAQRDASELRHRIDEAALVALL